MAHFAKLDANNVVEQVIVVNNNELLDENGNESEAKGIEFCQSHFGGTWVQTSYNKKFRKNYAAIGGTYNPELDVFIPKKPFPSWVLNQSTFNWEAPVPYPENTNFVPHVWDEASLSWIPVKVDKK